LGSDITSPLIEAAKADALHAHGACEDIIAVLFPKGRQFPSEALQAAVGAKLHDLICSIEFALRGDGRSNCDANGFSVAWQPMIQAGALRQASVLSFALARVAEEALILRLTAQGGGAALSFLPARLISHSSELLAQLARDLLAAEQASRNPRKSLYAQLEPTLLNRMVWQVADTLYRHGSEQENAVKVRAQALLVNQNVTDQISVAAQKLLFAIESDFHDDLVDPARAGLHLFVAELAREFSMPHDSVIRMIEADTAAPIAMLLAMRGVSRDEAFMQIQMLRGQGRDDRELSTIFAHYKTMIDDEARDVMSQWRSLEGDGSED
jgi:hypothetical protein